MCEPMKPAPPVMTILVPFNEIILPLGHTDLVFFVDSLFQPFADIADLWFRKLGKHGKR